MQFHPNTCLTSFLSPLGQMTLAASPTGLSGVWFEGQKHIPPTTQWRRCEDHPILTKAQDLLKNYFSHQWEKGLAARHMLKLMSLDISGGTAFQQAVWQALLSIPMGSTCSYGEVAAAIGRPRSVRAVGTAIGQNPLSILIPCHRVLGSQGQMTGYAGGVWRKQALLELESAEIET